MSETDVTNTEARWRNYQKLIWTQQQIQLQIHKQQQQQQSVQQYQSKSYIYIFHVSFLGL